MKQQPRNSFKLRQTSVAVMTALAAMASSQVAQANLGYGWAVMQDGAEMAIPTFFANSPSGTRLMEDPLLVPDVQAAIDTLYPDPTDPRRTSSGKALRKFIDPLPLPGVVSTMADGTTRSMTVGVASKWQAPQAGMPGHNTDDYYEIAVVEYKTKMHSDLANPTTLRGYVQIDHVATNSDGANSLPGSEKFPLTYPDGSAIMVQAVNADGSLKFDNAGVPVMKQALAVHKPDYLGPAIVAMKGTPIRYKFYNLLPSGFASLTGAFAPDGTREVADRRGDLFIPVDPSLMGAGYGPDGINMYSQNRATIHLHGGDTPWISDGTPHQWIAPAGESVINAADGYETLAERMVDETYLPQYMRGASAVNVPDMPDPGPGAMTFYFPNEQSGRLMFYHDHSAGITRLNVYAGEAAPYILFDDVDVALTNGGDVVRGGTTTTIAKALPSRWIPLVLQDKTFVPEDIALQDARWSTSAWGGPSDLWFPHVYETVQDPLQANNWNAVGRWHYGPYFWPVFPALYELPTGQYENVTTTPEAWQDTAVVNGVAYPTLTVDPTSYRLRILNAANDRIMTFNLFVADSTLTTDDGRTNTEVKMQPAMLPDATNGLTACAAGVTRPQVDPASASGFCTPETWPTDNRGGGVPSADSAGPTLYQFGSEGGLLPKMVAIDPTPINYQYDRGRATVLNVLTDALYLGPAERAEVVVDFSAYAGKTLIVYNDAPAPVPAGDPRNDYFTGVGDQSAAGGAENTLPGYGPNTRTMMQIKVNAAMSDGSNIVAWDPTTLDTELPKAYALAQERPVVGQSVYNAPFGEMWNDNVSTNFVAGGYASIYVGSLKEPVFKFQPGTPGLWNSVLVTNIGSGYTSAPKVEFDTNPAAGVSALATLKISNIEVTNPGSGYTAPPVVSIVAQRGGGTGAIATSSLKVVGFNITSGGTGYSSANPPTVTFSAPQDPNPLIAIQATGTAIIDDATGKVTGIAITNAGRGYDRLPTVSIGLPYAGAVSTTRARATVVAGVGHVKLVAPDPANPITYDALGNITNLGSAGGGGYTDLGPDANGVPGVAITFIGNAGSGGAAASATGSVFDVTMVNYGDLNAGLPNVTLTGGGGVGATVITDTAAGAPQGSTLVKTKAVHELFDATYGRLNSIGAVEIPFTSALTQTTIPLAYIDPPTEMYEHGETQIWKFTHNGVDTHPVHFHLLNVQVINRVGWDGFVAPPSPNELGWKETVKMNPLEDIIVAVRAKKPLTPGWGLPHSVRLLDPTQPEGSPFGFTQVDANTGNPAVVTNTLQDFKWEYVWHCHILGHEENDFMRPVVFDAKEPAATAPSLLAGSFTLGTGVNLAWTDMAVSEYRFDILRAPVDAAGVVGAYATIGQGLANSSQFTDATAVAESSYSYMVTAVGQNGSNSATVLVHTFTPPVAPSDLAAVASSASNIDLTWTDSLNETSYNLLRSEDGGVTWATLTSLAANTVMFADAGVQPNTAYAYMVAPVNIAAPAGVNSNVANAVTPPVMVSALAATATATQVDLTWTNANPGITTVTVTRNDGVVIPAVGNTATDTGVTANTAYTYTVSVAGANGTADATVAATTAPVAVSGLAATATATQVDLTWTNANPGVTTVTVTRNDGAVVPVVGNTASDTTVLPNTAYTYTVSAAGSNGSADATVAATTAPVAVSALAATSTATQVDLTWTNANPNATTVTVTRNDGAAVPVVGNTASDTNVLPGVTYTYTVSVAGANGTADASITATTALPAASGLAVGAVTASSVALSWTLPNVVGMTGVQVVRGDGVVVLSDATATATSALDTTVAANTAYSYTVVVTFAGGSASTAPVNATTLPVSAVMGATLSDTTSVTLNWTNSNPNATTVNVLRNGVAVATGLVGAVSFTDLGLVPNTSYSYTVEVVGAGGTAAATATGTTTPAALVAGVTSATPYSVTLNWSIPAQGTLSSITVTRNDGVTSTLAGTATSFVDTAAMPSMDYTYTLVATGLNGTATTAMGPVHTPAALALPTGYSARLVNATTVELRWTDTSVGETGYRLRMRLNGGAWNTVAPASMSAITYGSGGAMSALVTITGVQAQYDFDVAALDGATVGAVTARQRVDLTQIPTRPASLLSAPAIGGVFNLQWADAANNNDRYELQVRSRPVGGAYTVWSVVSNAVGANDTAYQYNGATTGMQYQFQIRAVNVRGASQWRQSGTLTAQ